MEFTNDLKGKIEEAKTKEVIIPAEILRGYSPIYCKSKRVRHSAGPF